jgi:hypothetical protein
MKAAFAAAGAVAVVAVVAGLGSQFVSPFLLAVVVGLALVAGVLRSLAKSTVHFLAEDEQLRVQLFTGAKVHNGPGMTLLNPLSYRSAEKVKVDALGTLDFLKVKDITSGVERIEKGPQLFFPGPYERVTQRGQGISLSNTDYALVEDKLSGERRVVKGPCMWFPGPYDEGHKSRGISLGSTEFITVEDRVTGVKHTQKGPCVWFPGPNEVAAAKQTAITVQDDEYVLLKDTASGLRWVQQGKALIFLEPTWRVEGANTNGGVKKAMVLKVFEYVQLLNTKTGSITTHRGEMTVVPAPDEEVIDGKKKAAVQIDDEHAALVRDKATGQLRLVTEKQLLVPGSNEIIEGVRELIKLADHEAMIVKDKDGDYHYYYGSKEKRGANQSRSFFLPPNSETVKTWWSRGPRRERKDVSFDRFDMRPHFMKFEFNCRTADNVELILEGIFFWEIIDLPMMTKMTSDTSGDLVYHVRSQFIQHVARVTLRTFMEELHKVAKTVQDEDQDFYKARGIKVHSLEMTRYSCACSSTAEILEQIIQETTNRMNRLSQAESENEVNLFRTQGQIEQANLNNGLLQIQHVQTQEEAKVAGSSEASRVEAFLEQLEKKVPNLDNRIKIWETLRKGDNLSVVSQGGASLYYTPADVDLSIETRNTPAKTAASK